MDADPHEVALWVLLKRTQSPNKSIRMQAVQELADNHHWHGKNIPNGDISLEVSVHIRRLNWDQFTPIVNNTDYQYQTAAQFLDQRTAVGLARTPQVDLRFFLSPPTLPILEDVCISAQSISI